MADPDAQVRSKGRQAQERYRRNFDKFLRSPKKLITEVDLFLVRNLYFGYKKLNLLLVAEDPYRVSVVTQTIVTLIVGDKVKHTIRDRSVKTPYPSTYSRRKFLIGSNALKE